MIDHCCVHDHSSILVPLWLNDVACLLMTVTRSTVVERFKVVARLLIVTRLAIVDHCKVVGCFNVVDCCNLIAQRLNAAVFFYH